MAAGADAIGLVLAPSPRRITPEKAVDLVAGAGVETFLVTVDASASELLDLAIFTGASGVQPHGERAEEASAAARRAGLTVLRPVRVAGRAAGLVSVDHVPADQIPLLDTDSEGRHGGTGRRFDPAMVGDLGRRWVMAGGLSPDNVAEAIADLQPWGVDASSGLESSPGVKDLGLIRGFVEQAKAVSACRG